MGLTVRPATENDLPVLGPLIDAAIDELQKGFLDHDQIKASHQIMGVDHQLVEDETYYVVEDDGRIVGCGGWSRRETLYGAEHSAGRSSRLLDPRTEPARIRAMYTHPSFARRGVGRLVLAACTDAAAAAGFARLSLMATLAGVPLYTAAGFTAVEDVVDSPDGVPIPLVRMIKEI